MSVVASNCRDCGSTKDRFGLGQPAQFRVLLLPPETPLSIAKIVHVSTQRDFASFVFGRLFVLPGGDLSRSGNTPDKKGG